MRNLLKTGVLLLLVLVSVPKHAIAGPGFGGGVSDAGHGGGGGAAPVDGGLSFLVIAGVGYGVKKMKAAKDRKKNEEQTAPTTELFK